MTEKILTDSLLALKAHQNKVGAKDWDLYTYSPFVKLTYPKSHYLEDRRTRTEVMSFIDDISICAREIFQKIMATDNDQKEELALTFSGQFSLFARKAFKFSMIKEKDLFQSKILIPKIQSNQTPDLSILNSLRQVDSFSKAVIEYPTDYHFQSKDMDSSSFSNRVQLYGLEGIASLAILNLPSWADKILSRSSNHLFVYKPNELVLDTVLVAKKMGFRITNLKMKLLKDFRFLSEKPVKDQLDPEVLKPILLKFLENWIDPVFHHYLNNFYFNECHKYCQQFEQRKDHYLNELAALSINENAFIISNYPVDYDSRALYSAFKILGGNTISAQHGVTPEVRKLAHEFDMLIEHLYADHTFCYGPQFKKIFQKKNPTHKNIIDVGVPSQYFNLKKLGQSEKNCSYDVAFISVCFLRGTSGHIGGNATDLVRIKEELEIIDRILGPSGKKVLYKPYPQALRSYFDSSPIKKSTSAWSNIFYYDDMIDLRYLMQKCKLLICSHSTSTVGWILFSEKPFIYIEFENFAPFRPEVAKDFKKAVFFFDFFSPTFEKDLMALISKSEKEIKVLWEEKKLEREKLKRKYYTTASDKNELFKNLKTALKTL